MNLKEFNKKWGGVVRDTLSEESELEFVSDSFSLYENAGFLNKFDSPYDDNGEHNGMGFSVIRRATIKECDLEAMPIWLIRFENGDEAYCYPEEICSLGHK